ncbi:cation transporter [Priestia taiwanensis]|uniref:Copper chaperone CopZ n=1 Tax=Priestia taiwanensis TaxID=1347902 RepID=A0A917AUF0_9BACI|nr:cation transporter [Priestia taiwanensis]MBM7364323.1 copper chaperone [Priestia taiwanensis]GGE73502.1 copper chaperone CopZ [Priestia taiwanensis]
MSQTVLKVEGMSCGHCVAAVEGELTKLGVVGKVDLGKKEVAVDVSNTDVTIDQVKDAIEDQGYTVIA